jgi:hypothetical protein
MMSGTLDTRSDNDGAAEQQSRNRHPRASCRLTAPLGLLPPGNMKVRTVALTTLLPLPRARTIHTMNR